MSRASITAAFKSAFNAPGTTDGLLVFLTLVMPAPVSTTRRRVRNMSDLTRGGNAFTAASIEGEMPADSETGSVECTFRVEDVDGTLTRDYQALDPSDMGTGTFELVRTSGPTGTADITLAVTVQWVELAPGQVVLRCKLEEMLDEECPADSMTPETCPGLF